MSPKMQKFKNPPQKIQEYSQKFHFFSHKIKIVPFGVDSEYLGTILYFLRIKLKGNFCLFW